MHDGRLFRNTGGGTWFLLEFFLSDALLQSYRPPLQSTTVELHDGDVDHHRPVGDRGAIGDSTASEKLSGLARLA